MTFADLILLGLFGCACYFMGKVSMAHAIVKEALNEIEQDSDNEASAKPGELFVEKVNGCYYAYVNQTFVGQATTFNELFTAMKKRKGIGSFTVRSDLDTLDPTEQDSMVKALSDVYGAK